MGKMKDIKKPCKKTLVIAAAVFSLAAAAVVLFFMGQGSNVSFTVLQEKDIPQDISRNVIPEYRTLERALACKSGEKVYVVVTRGEKPASGYKVEIKKMKLCTEDGKDTLVVYAEFKDPAKGNSLSQVLTYPVKVAETDITKLPDDIELRVQYAE